MANDSSSPVDPRDEEYGAPVTPEAASSALDELEADSARLAERIVTPWWYHLSLGAIVAAIVGSQVLPMPGAMILLALGIAGLPVLTVTYRRRYGVSTEEPAGAGSRRLLVVVLLVLAAAMTAALVIRATGVSPWWGLVPAAAAFVATLVLGRRYDAALRSEISGALGMPQ